MKKFLLFLVIAATFALTLWNKLGVHSEALSWMEDQIQEDLCVFSKEDLNPDRLRASFQSAPQELKLVFFQIKDNQVYWQSKCLDPISLMRTKRICKMFYRLAQKGTLKDICFLMSMHDGLTASSRALGVGQYLPIFSFAKTVKAQNAILIPDPLTEEFARKRSKKISFKKLKPQNYWSKKVEKAFWRGGTTGGTYLPENWFHKPRTKLVLLSSFYPDLVDAGFTSFLQMDDNVRNKMLERVEQREWVSHYDHLKYKYLVIADGNTCTYPRFYLGLISNSLVFKDKTDHYQWFYRQLKPNVHYISVKEDFSDLPDKVEWAKKNDRKAREISKNATKFISNNLTLDHIDRYTLTLIDNYAKLQDESFEISYKMQLFEPSKKFVRYMDE